MQTINWAVIGCGHIAKTFMAGQESLTNTKVVACAASDAGRAQAFADEFGIPKHYGSYNEMLQDRSIHAVYIATTHNFHCEHILMCLHNGKHVLCEKPLTLNAIQAERCFNLAKQNNLLLVEALWTRFLPAFSELNKILAEKTIGDIQCVQANFSLNRELPSSHRLNDPALAGGALLDLGIYPITMADIVFGKMPSKIESHHVKTATGVDQNSFYTLIYDCGGIAQLSAGFRMSGPTYATIMGNKGVIEIPFFLGATSFTLTIEGKPVKEYNFPFDGADNFKFEIDHVTKLVQKSLESNQQSSITSEIMPPNTTTRLMHIMDTIRQQWKLHYPDEN